MSIAIPLFETFFLLMPMWFMAYFGPSMQILVTINEYNEAIPEFIMWIVLVPLCFYGAYLNIKSIVKEDKQIYLSMRNLT